MTKDLVSFVLCWPWKDVRKQKKKDIAFQLGSSFHNVTIFSNLFHKLNFQLVGCILWEIVYHSHITLFGKFGLRPDGDLYLQICITVLVFVT